MALFIRNGIGGFRHLVSIQSIPFPASDKQVQQIHEKHKEKIHVFAPRTTIQSFRKFLPKNVMPQVSCGIGVQHQYRFVHTDVTKVPDFDNYRLNSTKNPAQKATDTETQRKVYTYVVVLSGAVMATYSAKSIVHKLVGLWSPNAKVLADSTLEVDISSIPEGKNMVFKWRNKPLFVRHRTEDEVSQVRQVPLAELRDPTPDEKRVQKDQWLIVVGICTHLGCVPIANAGEFGGYYCPCHGSHYDASGRIRKGPAPLNLEVPEYKFLDENVILVG